MRELAPPTYDLPYNRSLCMRARSIRHSVQGWAKEWPLGCENPASLLPLAAGGEFTQPRDYSFAHPCTRLGENICHATGNHFFYSTYSSLYFQKKNKNYGEDFATRYISLRHAKAMYKLKNGLQLKCRSDKSQRRKEKNDWNKFIADKMYLPAEARMYLP